MNQAEKVRRNHDEDYRGRSVIPYISVRSGQEKTGPTETIRLARSVGLVYLETSQK